MLIRKEEEILTENEFRRTMFVENILVRDGGKEVNIFAPQNLSSTLNIFGGSTQELDRVKMLRFDDVASKLV